MYFGSCVIQHVRLGIVEAKTPKKLSYNQNIQDTKKKILQAEIQRAKMLQYLRILGIKHIKLKLLDKLHIRTIDFGINQRNNYFEFNSR